MNKKRICILCVRIVFGIMAGCFQEEKYENHIPMKPDMVSSISINLIQYLTVVANRDRIEDKDEFTKLLVKMFRENSFHTIKFSTDSGYATGIHMQIYLCDNDIEEAKVAMKIDYVQREYNEKYDICNNPEEFKLFVDGKVIEQNFQMGKQNQRIHFSYVILWSVTPVYRIFFLNNRKFLRSVLLCLTNNIDKTDKKNI